MKKIIISVSIVVCVAVSASMLIKPHITIKKLETMLREDPAFQHVQLLPMTYESSTSKGMNKYKWSLEGQVATKEAQERLYSFLYYKKMLDTVSLIVDVSTNPPRYFDLSDAKIIIKEN